MRIGRILSSERLFHDVSYETQLVDSSIYLYEFTNRTLYTVNTQQQHQQNGSDSWSESESASQSGGDLSQQMELSYNNSNMPNGIITDLTHCYVPTCWDVKPCYSPICPKRLSQVNLYGLPNQQMNIQTKTCFMLDSQSRQ